MKSISPTEKKVLELIAVGYSTNEVAAALAISKYTVLSHRRSLLGKFGVNNSVQLITSAIKHRVIVVPDREQKNNHREDQIVPILDNQIVQKSQGQIASNDQHLQDQRIVDQLKLAAHDLFVKVINQILALSKLDSDRLTFEKTQHELNSFLTNVTGSFFTIALQKGITLAIELPTTRYVALFDRVKFETILVSVINYTVRVTSSGGAVNVKLFLEKTEQRETAQLVLKVSDVGIGNPTPQPAKTLRSRIDNQEVSGVGLSLVEELVRLMDGKITMSGDEEEGIEFEVVLPIELVSVSVVEKKNLLDNHVWKDNGVGHTKEDTDQSETNPTKVHVLVVEHSKDLRKFIADSLGKNFDLLEADNVKQGIERALEETPDLIISGVAMPGVDGISMVEKLKKDTRTSHIPLILLTPKTSHESKLSGLTTSSDDYLTKPFSKQELLQKVKKSIAHQVELREKHRLELNKESTKEAVQSADEKFLLKVKAIIMSRLGDQRLSVESLAAEIALSRSQLLRKVTALTGVSVNELIRTFRLQRAAQLLEKKWGPVTQVAYEVGFSNLSYFSKVFKEQYGVQPSEYPQKG